MEILCKRKTRLLEKEKYQIIEDLFAKDKNDLWYIINILKYLKDNNKIQCIDKILNHYYARVFTRALMTCNYQIATTLIDLGAKPFKNALHVTYMLGDIKLIAKLVEKAEFLNVEDEYGLMPIEYANNNIETHRILVKQIMNVYSCNNIYILLQEHNIASEFLPLQLRFYQAILRADVDSVQKTLPYLKINTQDTTLNNTALHFVCIYNDIIKEKYNLEDLTDDFISRRIQILKNLIRRNPNPYLKNIAGKTAFDILNEHKSSANNKLELFSSKLSDELTEYISSLNDLSWGVSYGLSEIIDRYLQKYDTDITPQDYLTGNTMLHYACHCQPGYRELYDIKLRGNQFVEDRKAALRILLDRKPDLTIKNNDGKTINDIIITNGLSRDRVIRKLAKELDNILKEYEQIKTDMKKKNKKGLYSLDGNHAHQHDKESVINCDKEKLIDECDKITQRDLEISRSITQLRKQGGDNSDKLQEMEQERNGLYEENTQLIQQLLQKNSTTYQDDAIIISNTQKKKKGRRKTKAINNTEKSLQHVTTEENLQQKTAEKITPQSIANDLEQLKMEMNILVEKVKAGDQEENKYQQKINIFKTQLNQSKIKHIKLQKQYDALYEQKVNSDNRIKTLEKQNSSFILQDEELKSHNAELQQQIKNLEKRLNISSANSSKLEREKTQLDKKYNPLHKELEQSQQNLENIKKKIPILKSQNKQLTQQYSAWNKEKVNLENVLKDTQEENSTLTAENINLISCKAELQKERQEKVESFEGQDDKSHQDAEQINEQYNLLYNKRKKSKKKLVILKHEYQKLENESNALEEQIHFLTSQNQELQERLNTPIEYPIPQPSVPNSYLTHVTECNKTICFHFATSNNEYPTGEYQGNNMNDHPPENTQITANEIWDGIYKEANTPVPQALAPTTHMIEPVVNNINNQATNYQTP